MSITDELRSWAARRLAGWKMLREEHDELTAIADRIDAEHQKAMSRAGQLLADAEKDRDYNYANWQECKQKVLQGNITIGELNAKIEHLMDELPHCMDADNVPVCIGDRMELVRYKDGDPTIVRTVSGIGNGVFFAWSKENGRYAQYEADAYRHYHAPTVEDVLREFYVYAERGKEHHREDVDDAVLAEYAARLRLAGDE